QHTPEQAVADTNTGDRLQEANAVAAADAGQLSIREQKGLASLEADDFRLHRAAALAHDRAESAERGGEIRNRRGQTDETADAPRQSERQDQLDLLFDGQHGC